MTHVVVIDADKQLRTTYVAALEASGMTAVSAASAQSAIGLCEEQTPDVIVLELQLQEHSGVEFLHELRSYPEWQEIPVVLHTLIPAKDLDKFDQAFKTMGIVGYGYKPDTSLKKLINLVENASLVKL